jgi:hypothetical protein
LLRRARPSEASTADAHEPEPPPEQKNELSSRPERSEVEGPAVASSAASDQNGTNAIHPVISSEPGSWIPDATRDPRPATVMDEK